MSDLRAEYEAAVARAKELQIQIERERQEKGILVADGQTVRPGDKVYLFSSYGVKKERVVDMTDSNVKLFRGGTIPANRVYKSRSRAIDACRVWLLNRIAKLNSTIDNLETVSDE